MVYAINSEIKEVLKVMGFTDFNSVPKMKDVVKTYHKMALKKHPDKPGGSTEQFQKLQEAFLKVGSYINSCNDKVDDLNSWNAHDEEERFAKTVFKDFCLNGKFYSSKKYYLFSEMFKQKIKELRNAEKQTFLEYRYKRYNCCILDWKT